MRIIRVQCFKWIIFLCILVILVQIKAFLKITHIMVKSLLVLDLFAFNVGLSANAVRAEVVGLCLMVSVSNWTLRKKFNWNLA